VQPQRVAVSCKVKNALGGSAIFTPCPRFEQARDAI